MNRLLRLLCITCLLLPAVAGAQIYKCENAQGVVEFTDQPCASAETVTLKESNISNQVERIEFAGKEVPRYASNKWYQDADGYRSAQRLAEKYQAPIIYYFRVDWCPYCLAVENNLLNQQKAMDTIKPFIKVQINPEHGDAEKGIFDQMGGRGYPTLLVKPYKGKPSRVGVTPGKSENSDKKYISAERFVEKMARYIPTPPPRSAPEFHAHARKAFQQQNYKQALDYIKQAIEREPRAFEHYKLLDDILAQANDWDQIVQYWTSYLALVPQDADAFVERSGSNYHKGDVAAARQDAQAAADLGSVEGLRLLNQLNGG